MEQVFPRVYMHDNKLYTENTAPDHSVYGEPTTTVNGTEYRSWNPHRSKAAAAIVNGVNTFPITPQSTVLYLGAATGTTVSHFADIAVDGFIAAVEYAAEPMHDLVDVAAHRSNIAPLLRNARNPDTYRDTVEQVTVDVVYQDIAQQDQAEIFLRNLQFLAEGGTGVLCVKAQSIDSAAPASTVFTQVREQLQEQVTICETLRLEPFHTDHLFIRCRKQ